MKILFFTLFEYTTPIIDRIREARAKILIQHEVTVANEAITNKTKLPTFHKITSNFIFFSQSDLFFRIIRE